MNILTIVKSIGSAIVTAILPKVGEKIVEEVNSHIEVAEERLDPKAVTGEEVAKTIESLPPEKRAMLQKSQIELETISLLANIQDSNNWVLVQQALIEAEKKGSWIRPFVVIVSTILMVAGVGLLLWIEWFKAYSLMKLLETNPDKVLELKEFIPQVSVVLSIIATPVGLIWAFFGKRSYDRAVRTAAAVGQDISSAKGLTGRAVEYVGNKVLRRKK